MIQTVREPKLITIRKKRKGGLHYCHYCLRDFQPGSKMYRATYSDDCERSIWNIYHCEDCEEFLNRADNKIIDKIKDPWDNTLSEGCINDFLFECGGHTIEMLDMFFEKHERGKT